MAVQRLEYRRLLAQSANRTRGRIRVRYLIVAQMRTGSSWLVSLLNSLPEVCNKGEILNQNLVQGLRRGLKLDWEVRRHLKNTLDSGEQPVSGAKILRHQAAYSRLTPEKMAAWLPGVRVILLYRSRQFQQYVSQLSAQKTGVWVRRRSKEGPLPSTRVRVDAGLYSEFVEDTCRFHDGFVEALSRLGVPFVALAYETLAADPGRVFEDRICPLLDTPMARPTSAHEKMSRTPISQRVENFEEVAHLVEREWRPTWDGASLK